MKLKVKADPETNAFNITLNFINEQEVHFDVDPDQQAEFELEIVITTQNLTAIEVNGVNQTIEFPSPNTNKVTVDDVITGFKLFLPQNELTTFATLGRSFEGDFLNTLTNEQTEIFYNYLELYNPNSTTMSEIVVDLKTEQQKAYEIIGKINKTGFYDSTNPNLEGGGGHYKDHYNNSTDITDFFDNLLQKVRDTADLVIVGDGD